MFNKTLYDIIIADSALMGFVSSTNGIKSVFSDCVPEESAFPYVTIRIMESIDTDRCIGNYPIYIDYFDSNTSKVNANLFSKRLDILLDGNRLSNSDHCLIRIKKERSEFIQDNDPKAIHLNCQFTGRGDRKYWIDSLNK